MLTTGMVAVNRIKGEECSTCKYSALQGIKKIRLKKFFVPPICESTKQFTVICHIVGNLSTVTVSMFNTPSTALRSYGDSMVTDQILSERLYQLTLVVYMTISLSTAP